MEKITYTTQKDGSFSKTGSLNGQKRVQILIDELGRTPFGNYSAQEAQTIIEEAYSKGQVPIERQGYQILPITDSKKDVNAMESTKPETISAEAQDRNKQLEIIETVPEVAPIVSEVIKVEAPPPTKPPEKIKRGVILTCGICGNTFNRGKGRYPAKICLSCKAGQLVTPHLQVHKEE